MKIAYYPRFRINNNVYPYIPVNPSLKKSDGGSGAAKFH